MPVHTSSAPRETVTAQSHSARSAQQSPMRENAQTSTLSDLQSIADESSSTESLRVLQRKADGANRQIPNNAPTSQTIAQGTVVQRVLSDQDSATLAGYAFAGRVPTVPELATFTAFFDTFAQINGIVPRFQLGSYTELAQICALRFSAAELLQWLAASPGVNFTRADATLLDGLNGQPSMADILGIFGQALADGAVTLGNIAGFAGLNYTLAEIAILFPLAIITNWQNVLDLSAANVAAADVQIYQAVTIGGVACTVAQMITCQNSTYSAAEVAQLAGFAQILTWQHVSDLSGANIPMADIVVYDPLTIGGAACSVQQMIACHNGPKTAAETAQLAGLAQVTTWPELDQISAIANWPVVDLIAFSAHALGGNVPTFQEMREVTHFTPAQANHLLNEPDWATVVEIATIHGADPLAAPSPAVITAMATLGTNEVKADQAGVVDQARSCWDWATQGFEAPDVPDSMIFDYFALRTGFPGLLGPARNHDDTVTYLANENLAPGVDPVRIYLAANQAALGAIVANWQVNVLANAENARGAAQLELMRLHLTNSGFNVLPQGTAAHWYICMHELKNNVSWEHWWIKTSSQEVIETFPATPDGRGQSIFFHRGQHNMGNLATDFRHEVPVVNLLPAQQFIIRRAMVNAQNRIDAHVT